MSVPRRTTISVDEELHKELDEARRRYMPNATWALFLRMAWPRCPACGGRLAQEIGMPSLKCLSCGREYVLAPKAPWG